MSVESQINKLLQNHPKGFDLSLGRIRELLSKLGDPQTKIPPAFHIAGTNGKGSTTAFLRAIIEANDNTAHVHTSPHLVNWNERYRLGCVDTGRLVSDDELEQAIIAVSNANAGKAITVFEIMSAVGFVLFSNNKADYSIIEVGLGGRADATNVIENPLACIITPVSLDHQSYLGDTIEKIAFEKAGIIKENSCVVIGQQTDGARQVIEDIAQQMNCKTYIARQDFDAYEERGRFIYQDEFGLMDLPMPNLKGVHQIENASMAIAATRYTGIISKSHVFETAMGKVKWPGRFERLEKGKLISQLPTERQEDFDIWIDGGHNPAAGQMLAAELTKLKAVDALPLYMICAMLTTKDPSGFFDHFKDKVEQVFTVPITNSDAAFEASLLSQLAYKSGLVARDEKSVSDAFQAISKIEKGRARIIICGSLYLVGDILDQNGTSPS